MSELYWLTRLEYIQNFLVIVISVSGIALLIWGVGSTIDYIQENETAKQLPDKCINALNDWVESLSDPKNNQTKGEQ